MKRSRRNFIELSIKAGVALPLIASSLVSCGSTEEKSPSDSQKDKSKLKILLLGGTSFLGPHQIAYALSQGHSVSTFTRGKTKPTIYQDLFRKVEQLVGDRQDDLESLKGKKWDVVIDNSGHKAEWTARSAALLKDSCDLYLYTSSTGVYYPYLGNTIEESEKLVTVVPEGIDAEMKMEYDYGVMKTKSEQAALKEFGADRTIIVRPTYMFGPADQTDRFTYWPVRLSQGGETMVPGKSDDPVQYIDVRDVATWMIKLAEQRKTGIFNAVGPADDQTMYSFVQEAQSAFDVPSTFVYIDDYEFLKEHNVHYIIPWIMPIENNYGSSRVSNSKALANGLEIRPLVDSIRDTHAWWFSDAVSQDRRDKLTSSPESVMAREEMLLDQWAAR